MSATSSSSSILLTRLGLATTSADGSGGGGRDGIGGGRGSPRLSSGSGGGGRDGIGGGRGVKQRVHFARGGYPAWPLGLPKPFGGFFALRLLALGAQLAGRVYLEIMRVAYEKKRHRRGVFVRKLNECIAGAGEGAVDVLVDALEVACFDPLLNAFLTEA